MPVGPPLLHPLRIGIEGHEIDTARFQQYRDGMADPAVAADQHLRHWQAGDPFRQRGTLGSWLGQAGGNRLVVTDQQDACDHREQDGGQHDLAQI